MANNQQSSLKSSVQISFWQELYVVQGSIKALNLWVTSGKRKGYYLSYKMRQKMQKPSQG